MTAKREIDAIHLVAQALNLLAWTAFPVFLSVSTFQGLETLKDLYT